MPHRLAGLSATYRDELLDGVVPFWLKHSVDRECGGFLTCLDREGRPYGTDKYMWLQGRAVWMFARLYNELSPRPEWLEAARQGLDFIRRFGRSPEGRVYFCLTRDGRPVHIQRKIYSETFFVLALTEMARATGDPALLAEAKRLFWLIHDLWRHPEKLGRPVLEGTPRGTTLADPMVFLCMIEELQRLEADERYEALAEEMKGVVLRHIRPDRRVVLENVGPGGEFLDTPQGRLLNPGHAIETAWFLIHLAKRTDDKPLIATALDVIDWSMERGWDSEHGGLYYFLDCGARPPMQLEWSMKLWWPATEALYALLLAWDVSGDERWLTLHDRVHRYAFERFRDPEFGEWFGYLDREGRPTHTLKGGAWKGFFHIPRALLYCHRLLERRARKA